MPYEIPSDISSFNAEELDKSLTEVMDEFASLANIADEELTDDQVSRMEALSAHATDIKAKQEADAAAFAERSAKLADMRASMAKKPDEEKDKDEDESDKDKPKDDENPEGDTEPPVTEDPAPEDPEQPVNPEDPSIEEIIEELPSDEDEDEKKKENAVVASGKTPIANTARKAPKVDETKSTGAFSIAAAADVPQIATGTSFASLKEAAKAISNRLDTMPNADGMFSRTGALVFKNVKPTFSQKDYRDDLEMLMAAGNESRLEGGSLVAAGGWGAPSETLLDFCELESADGLIDLPEVTVDRGGLKFTKGPSFADVLASATGFWDMTEAVAEAGTELKTSLRPEVPEFTEVRLDAVGTMMEAGLLTRAGWPELVERYAAMALLAHEIKMHHKKLAGIRAFTGAAINVANGFGNAIDLLHVVDLVAAGERQRYSMPKNGTLEVLAPSWTHNVIRADLANRNGVDFMKVTDADIDSYFSARNLRVQWLNHYQPLDVPAGGIATTYPENVEFIMYPAGTYVAGVKDVITLDTVYDSTNLKKNDYVHLFVEQGLAVTNPCNDGRRFTVPLAITGTTGAANIDQALFRAPDVDGGAGA